MVTVWMKGQESTNFVIEMFSIGKEDPKFRNIYGLIEEKFWDWLQHPLRPFLLHDVEHERGQNLCFHFLTIIVDFLCITVLVTLPSIITFHLKYI